MVDGQFSPHGLFCPIAPDLGSMQIWDSQMEKQDCETAVINQRGLTSPRSPYSRQNTRSDLALSCF